MPNGDRSLLSWRQKRGKGEKMRMQRLEDGGRKRRSEGKRR
jgi:hypothetical protein